MNITGEMLTLKSKGKEFPTYVTKPTLDEIKGGLIVVHEAWGLVDHIKDVADRFAREGYLVLAPDLLSETGITAEQIGGLQEELFDPERRSQAQPKLRRLLAPMQAPDFADDTIAKLKNCFDYLYEQADTQQRVAITGFCFGGTYSFSLAVHEPKLKAAAPFYGHADYSVEELKQIECPILAFYGEKDENLMSSLPQLQENMHQANVDFTEVVYAGCGHAFFNDTNQFAYNKTAAKDAWKRVIDFLEINVSV